MNAHPAQLFNLLYSGGQFDKLDSALSQTHSRMEAAGEGHLWRFWRVALLAARGDIAEAEALADTLENELASEARRLLALTHAQREGDWSAAITLFTNNWEATQAPTDLLALCGAQLNAGNPSFVAEHAEELVEGMATVEALRIAVTGVARSERWSLCLRLLDKYVSLFPSRVLPSDLRRLRITAEQALGMMTEALRHAEELAHEEENGPNLDLLFQLRVRAGRLKDASSPAERLMRRHDTPPETLIRVARLLRLEDPVLASVALRTAIDRGVAGPEAVTAAYLIAHELGAEELVRRLHPQFVEEAQKSNRFLQKADLNLVIELQRQAAENAREVLNEWRRGCIPVHLVRTGVNVPLAWWPFQALAHIDEASLLSPHTPVFFRHGARSIESPPRTIRRLYADITAIVNAHALGILPLVEKAFGGLHLPPALRVSLVQQLDDIRGGQPGVIAGQKLVAQLVDKGAIKLRNYSSPLPGEDLNCEGIHREWWLALAEMQKCKGALVDHWPKRLRDGGVYVPKDETCSALTSGTEIVAALRKAGRITAKIAEEAERELQNSSQANFQVLPLRLGQTILLEGNFAEMLARAGVLEATMGAFELMMLERDANWIREELHKHEGRERVGAGLTALLEYLRAASNAVDFPLKEGLITCGEDTQNDAGVVCVEQLLQIDPNDDHWVWIDDRHLNAYEHCGGLPIISTLGILGELRTANHLSDAEYFELRHRLRAADFRYVPFTATELHHHLQLTSVNGGHLTETPELVVLRRYFATSILDLGTLQWPPLDFQTPKPQGEIEYLIGSVRSMADALVLIFATADANLETRHARADWIRRSLWLAPETIASLLQTSKPLPPTSPLSTRPLGGVGDEILLAKAIDRSAFTSIDRRAEYLAWVESTFLPDGTRQQAAAKQVSISLEGNAWRLGETKEALDVRAAIMSDWYLALPSSVRTSIDLRPATRSVLGLGLAQSVTIAGISFEATKFWRAAEAAYLGDPATLAALRENSHFRITVERHQDNAPVLLIHSERESQPWGMQDDILFLFDQNPEKRIESLRHHPEWLDSLMPKSNREIPRLANFPSGVDRILKIEECRSQSAWYFYQVLDRSFGNDPGPSLEAMAPPKPILLAHFLRLPRFKTTISPQKFETSARRMVNDLGAHEAIRRLALLPRDLPSAALAAFDALSTQEQQATIAKLCVPALSQITKTQAFRLMLRRGDMDAARALGSELLSEESVEETNAFLRVLRWSWHQFGHSPHSRGLKSAGRLLFSWVHANQLFAFVHAVSSPQHIAAFFTRFDTAPSAEFLTSAPGEDDIACVTHLSAKKLIIAAVASALRAENVSAATVAPDLYAKADGWCVQRQDDIHWPHLVWLHDPTLFPNALASFLGNPHDQLLASLLGKETAEEFSGQRIFREVEALVTALEQEPANDSAWILIGSLLRDQQCPPPLRERMRTLLERIDISTMNLGEVARHTAVFTFAALAWNVGGALLIKLAQTQIVGFAGWCKAQAGTLEEAKKRQSVVIQATQALSRSAPAEKSAQIFSDAMSATLSAWPNLVETLVDACDVLVSLPPSQLAMTTALLLQIRREAGRYNKTEGTQTMTVAANMFE